MFTSMKPFLRFIVIFFRKNENLRKVHHILLVYTMFHPGTYVCTYVAMCIHCVCNCVRKTCTYVCMCTFDLVN